MTHRLALPSALLCLLLGGCANQQPVVDAGLNQQLASLDANGQSTRTQIGELSGKLAALSAEQRRLQEVVATQASKIDHDQAARNGAAAALARHIEDSGKRLNELEARTRDTAAQADSLKPACRRNPAPPGRKSIAWTRNCNSMLRARPRRCRRKSRSWPSASRHPNNN